MNNDFILQDRLQKIRQIINEYGEENFYISVSGGKDSTVLSVLVDMAIPGNNIPRVWADTGLDFELIRKFVFNKIEHDNRFIRIEPSVPIIPMLKKYGYPFKSKQHSETLHSYQLNPDNLWPTKYVNGGYNWSGGTCPNILKYQFTPEFNIPVSDKCCLYMKEKPLNNWAKENNRPYHIIGIMLDEGGRRQSAKCLAFRNNKLHSFQPLVAVNKEWEKWFIDKYNIELCELYYPPYNFERTGCKGCPFNIKLQHELDILEKYFPNERKQCEIIWKPVYDEYRRIGYRLKKASNYVEEMLLEM